MYGVTQISVTEDVSLVTFSNVSPSSQVIADIFEEFASAGINIDMISQTAPQGKSVSVSFTVASDRVITILELINGYREKHQEIRPMISGGNFKIQLFGEEMRMLPGVAARALTAVASSGAELMLITTSEVDISLLISRTHQSEAVDALEKAFGISSVSAEQR